MCQIPYYAPIPLRYVMKDLTWIIGLTLGNLIEIWNVKSPTMPPHGAGGGYWGIQLTGA